MEGLNKKIV